MSLEKAKYCLFYMRYRAFSELVVLRSYVPWIFLVLWRGKAR
jgi:hypothetical protein